MTQIEGKEVKVGDWVGFKCDIEQSGKIVKINNVPGRGVRLTLSSESGFSGDYIGGDTETIVDADDCWL